MESSQEILPGVTALCKGSAASEHYVLFLNRLNASLRSAHIDDLILAVERLGRFVVSLDGSSIGDTWRNSAREHRSSLSAYPADVVEQVTAIETWLLSLRGKNVVILSQSRGGIVAALSENCAPVSRSVCFGYPFQSPETGAEPYRIRALSETIKPFLILQGTWDDYGGREAADKYLLPNNVRMDFYETEHGFIPMDEESAAHMKSRVLDFLSGGPL